MTEGAARPGLNPERLARLMYATIEGCRLNLSGHTVLTEAATGPYVVTPVLAALAGAEVHALAAPTRYATSGELEELTSELADRVGVLDRVHFVSDKHSEIVAAADIVTNSGQVRPIDAEMVSEMKLGAVVALMYESWEYRAEDVDLDACRARDILVAGTNECHPAVDVFAFLGPMAVKQLHDAGIAVYRSRIVVLCDNPFAAFIARGLRACGAEVVAAAGLSESDLAEGCDAVLVALQPHAGYVIDSAAAALMSRAAPGAVLVEFWGDTDREALTAAQVPVWPAAAPAAGHMAVLPSAVGPEPIVRLQAGGLKVGEVLARGLDQASPIERAFVQLM
ncbi:MAG TPA: hypothetical protein VG186_05575 [Solirubrobacteraceae bacterium]|jgi:hypothetical protein|nr:hypothetical protein [Solirubrobacteraceae bacterium]